jgi:hypothetical protein
MQAINKHKETIMEKQEEENLLALLKSTDDEDVILALIIILNNNMFDWLLSKSVHEHSTWYCFHTPYKESKGEIYWLYRENFAIGIGRVQLFISKEPHSKRGREI